MAEATKGSSEGKAAAGAAAKAGKARERKAAKPEEAQAAAPEKAKKGSSLTDHREIEIKLGVLGRPDSLSEVFASLGRVSRERSDLLENTYFHAPSEDLFKAGIGLRIRHGKDFSEQTLKLRGKNIGGLHSRGEYNLPIARSAKVPRLDKFPQDIFPDDFNAKAEQQLLQPMCRISFTRESFDFEIMDSLFEVAYDHGSIDLDTGAPYPINELEVELKSTTRSEDSVMLIYNALVTTFAEKDLPLVMEPFSKMHRAQVLLRGNRNSVNFSDTQTSSDLVSYISNLLSTFDNLYGLFLLKHDPLVFSYQNSTLRTLIRALKVLRKDAPPAFYKDEREPVSYDQELRVIIRTLKEYERRCFDYEKKIAKTSLDFDEYELSVLVDKVRRIENDCQIYVIPLKLRVLLSMIVSRR
ncbi:MAG: inorganic triphosphatase [Succinivibrio sp.]